MMQSVLQHLETWATRRGVLELILEVYYDNHAAVRSYERFGFEKSIILMRKSL
jgi:GNAT superfamily N-acetyltransferase